MEWNPETLQFLSQCFLHTHSPDPETRRLAESSLSKAADTPNYGLAVLRLVSEPSVDEQIRQAAYVNFKNHLRARWVLASPDESNPLIPDSEKADIKALIVLLMLSSTPKIQSQLSEALALIGKHDFPKLWPTLLPALIGVLQKASQASDYASINGILGTVNSVFEKFRYQYETDDLWPNLEYCLDNFAAPLLEIFLKTAALIDSAATVSPAAVIKPLFESQRLCCRIFYSLNFQELPEFFEDHMKEWMTEFRKYLITNYPVLENSGADGLAIVDELRAAVCENINLYIEIFNTLISSPSTAEQGFYVLNTVIESLEYDVIELYIRNIWAILFGQLQKWRAVKFLKSFLILMSLFVVKHGAMNLVDSMNSVQANIYSLILKQFWIPNFELITGAIELKLFSVASTRFIEFLGEGPALLDAANVELWGKMLDSIVTLLSRPEQDRVEEEQEMPDIAERVGYTASFVRLYNAGKIEEDLLKDIEDPKEVLVASLAGLSSRSPGRYPQIINQYLDPAKQAALLQLCNTYNRQIV